MTLSGNINKGFYSTSRIRLCNPKASCWPKKLFTYKFLKHFPILCAYQLAKQLSVVFCVQQPERKIKHLQLMLLNGCPKALRILIGMSDQTDVIFNGLPKSNKHFHMSNNCNIYNWDHMQFYSCCNVLETKKCYTQQTK